ncbi:MAG TPA: hypothetical protein ENI17_13485 [Pseudomonas xinjiangensis]|uniref:Acyl-coenzyme A synthetase/AMP-(Fatty) acid ligase n=2 Tax=root TaxID=1 RepID=A0A7V1BNJ0_9GAMM|nr:hypothetical protein [Halopseudomonas xinjiangensis]HEC48621.1 hypothetical protein [Halopseudomonas xinjiangensis]
MSFTPLFKLPWRQPAPTLSDLPAHWVDPARLVQRVDAWRGWLEGRSGGRWILCQPNPLEFTSALLALWESGRVAVLPADDRPGTLAGLIGKTDGQIPAQLDIPDSPNVSSRSAVMITPDTLALALYTSGSTGQPVEFSKTFAQLDAELAVHARLWPLTQDGCVIAQVSHQHIYGLLAAVLHPLCSGAPFCGEDCHYPERLAERMAEAGQAGLSPVMVSSPPQLARIPEHIDWAVLPRLQRVFSSGAPLAKTHAVRAESLLAAPVIEIYGSTETGGIAQRRQTLTEAWRALPDVELSFEGECLALRSSFLAEPDQWWQQPDRVSGTPECFHLLGRDDRLVKIGGKRVSLDRIERLLAEHPSVMSARCVDLGRNDGRLGCIVVLDGFCVPREHPQRHELTQLLRELLAGQIEQVTIPRYWRFVESLPCNAQGKLDRGLIERLFEDLVDNRKPRWLGTHQLDDRSCSLVLEVPERLVFLDGHFDEFPIVPGVVIVQWAVQQAERSFGQLGEFTGCEQLKFQRPLRPGMRLRLDLTQRENGIAFAFHSHEGKHANGRVSFQTAIEATDG